MSPIRTLSRCLLLMSAFALSGCGGYTPDYTPKVDRTTSSHVILFAAGSDAMDAAENEALGEFLSAISPLAVKDVSLNVGVSDESTDTRIGAVTSALRMQGFPAGKVVIFTGEDGLDANAMRLDVTYAVAIADERCPNWTRPGSNPLNATHSNFGCAYNKNLAAMLADPEDLEHGHGNNATSADRNALIIEHYRQGSDIVPPAASTPTTAPSTASASSSGSEGGGEAAQ